MNFEKLERLYVLRETFFPDAFKGGMIEPYLRPQPKKPEDIKPWDLPRHPQPARTPKGMDFVGAYPGYFKMNRWANLLIILQLRSRWIFN